MSVEAVSGVATIVTPGRELRGGILGLGIARTRFWASLAPNLVRAVLDDASFAFRQATGAKIPTARVFVARSRDFSGLVTNVFDSETVARLANAGDDRPDHQATVVQAGSPPETDVVEILPGHYSGLDASGRRRVLGSLTGRRVIIWGVLAQGQRVRISVGLRKVLCALGITAGEPGDVTFRGRSGGWHPFHLFTAEQMRGELIAAGGRDVDVRVVTAIGGAAYVRGTAQL